jgi:hypothetical protein
MHGGYFADGLNPPMTFPLVKADVKAPRAFLTSLTGMCARRLRRLTDLPCYLASGQR